MVEAYVGARHCRCVSSCTAALILSMQAARIGLGDEVLIPAMTFVTTGETEERITAVASWRDAPCFTDAERVALELVEAVLIPNPSGERVPDELYAEASAHYDVKALWTLTMVIGQMCFWIPVALIAKPIPGKEPHWSK
jgi:DegT/DnrJ/EryC1/StrS aminotransferase family